MPRVRGGDYVSLDEWRDQQYANEPTVYQECPETTFEPDQVLQAARDGHRKWQLITNLDEFLRKVYEYHQRHGLLCLLLCDMLELVQFFFVISFAVVLVTCVDYGTLFASNATTSGAGLGDVIKCNGSGSLCSMSNVWLMLAICFAALCWLHRAMRFVYRVTVFLDIRNFYQIALKINDSMLENMTWYDVQDRLCNLQAPYRLGILKSQLSNVDIYQRILRRENYLVAMFNKGLLPARFRLPLIGELSFMTLGLKFNLGMLFFWGPWSPWENYWQLKADYKRRDERQKLTDHLSRVILWFGVINLLLAPFIFAWQMLYCIFAYVETVKREPSALSTRRWSMYGRYFFRHFNELDHELNNRLNCAYKPAALYMQMFFSLTAEIVSKNVAFIAGALFSVVFILGVYDEDVLRVRNVLQVLTVSGFVVAICRTFIQDENAVFCPEMMMNTVLAYVHYMPESWRGQAHQDWVRREFSKFYQYRLTFIVEELVGAIACPLALLLWLRPSAGLFVEFFRNFTVEVPGLGDVCSLAQMDVRRYGDPAYAAAAAADQQPPPPALVEPLFRANHGKVEMSLLHFVSTNPRWQPPADAAEFLHSFRAQTGDKEKTDAFLCDLQHSLYGQPTNGQRNVRGRGVSQSVVPLDSTQLNNATSGMVAASSMLLSSSGGAMGAQLSSSVGAAPSLLTVAQTSTVLNLLSPVNVDILYLHELHKRRKRAPSYGSMRVAASPSSTGRSGA